jgi:poly(beta-D-mannuronate) lyase
LIAARIGRALLTAGLFLSVSLAAPARAQSMASPFPPYAGPTPSGPFACPTPAVPIVDLDLPSYYSDAARSVIDLERSRLTAERAKPVRLFLAQMASVADRAHAGDEAAAGCALDRMAHWAGAGALTGEMTQQGVYEMTWTTAGLALAYLKLRNVPGLDAAKQKTVEAWLGRLAAKIRPPFDRPNRIDSRNNHAYWAGLAVAAVGVATDKEPLLEWGVERYRVGLNEIAEDGTLPLELARRGRALHYHLFALSPLVLMAELGAANGLDLYEEYDGALHRLVRRAVEAIDDRKGFSALAGANQVPLRLAGDEAAWLAPYSVRFDDADVRRLAAAARTIRAPRLGGDLGAAFPLPEQP